MFRLTSNLKHHYGRFKNKHWKKVGDFSFDYKDFAMHLDGESREASQHSEVEYIHSSGHKIGFYGDEVAGGKTGRTNNLIMSFTTQDIEIFKDVNSVVNHYRVCYDPDGVMCEPVDNSIKISYMESKSLVFDDTDSKSRVRVITRNKEIETYTVIVTMEYPVNSKLIFNFLRKITLAIPTENGLVDDIFSTIPVEKPEIFRLEPSDKSNITITSNNTEMNIDTNKTNDQSEEVRDFGNRSNYSPRLVASAPTVNDIATQVTVVDKLKYTA